MKINIERFVAIFGIGLGLIVSANSATADSSSFKELERFSHVLNRKGIPGGGEM
jgi:hypothetical protein